MIDTSNRVPPQLQVNGPVQALFKDKIPDEKDSFITIYSLFVRDV